MPTSGGHLTVLEAEPVPQGMNFLIDGVAYVLDGQWWEKVLDLPRYTSHHGACKATKPEPQGEPPF